MFWENCILFLGCPRKFYHRVVYIAPSSGHESVNHNLPFELILRRFEVVFWYLEWNCCTFKNIDGNSFKSTNTIILHGFKVSNHILLTFIFFGRPKLIIRCFRTAENSRRQNSATRKYISRVFTHFSKYCKCPIRLHSIIHLQKSNATQLWSIIYF